MKKLILILIPVWLFTAGCVYYPYADSAYDTDSGYNYPYGYHYPYYSYPYYYYPYYYPWWGVNLYYGPRRWR